MSQDYGGLDDTADMYNTWLNGQYLGNGSFRDPYSGQVSTYGTGNQSGQLQSTLTPGYTQGYTDNATTDPFTGAPNLNAGAGNNPNGNGGNGPVFYQAPGVNSAVSSSSLATGDIGGGGSTFGGAMQPYNQSVAPSPQLQQYQNLLQSLIGQVQTNQTGLQNNFNSMSSGVENNLNLLGSSEKTALKNQLQNNQGASQQSAISRGLGNSTVLNGLQAQNQRTYNQGMEQLNENIAGQKNSTAMQLQQMNPMNQFGSYAQLVAALGGSKV